MALIKFQNYSKHNILRSRIVYSKTTQFTYNGKGYGDFVNTSVFKYEYKHPYIPPSLITFPTNGEKYIMPGSIKVHPKTELSDIRWIKPKKKVEKVEKETYTFESSSGSGVYTVTKIGDKIKCSCFGYVRSKGNCKHVKEVRGKS